MFASRRVSAAAAVGFMVLAAGCSSKSASTTPAAPQSSGTSVSSSAPAPGTSAPATSDSTSPSDSTSAAPTGDVPPAIKASGGESLLPGTPPAGVEAEYGPVCKGSDLGIPKFDPKTATIGWAQSEKEANPFRVASTKSEVAEAAKLGIKLLTTNAQSDPNKENSDIKGMIDQGAKAIIFSPINSTGLKPAIDYAKSKHVAMIPVDRNITGVKACQEVGPQLGSDFVLQGRRAADAMIKATGGTANLVILLGATGVNVTDDRTNGFLDELKLKNATGIKVIAQQTGNFNRADGQKVMETFLNAHPELNAVYAENDEMALGALVALKAKDKAGIDKTHIVSIDGTKGAVQGIVDGFIDVVIESNPAFGPAAEAALNAYVNGDGAPAVTITTDNVYDNKADAAKAVADGSAY